MESSARARIAPFYVMEVMKAAAEREASVGGVLHLEVGQPMTPAPTAVRRAAAEALQRDRLGYTDALGLPALRERIARYYAEAHGLEVPAGRVAVTTGASAGFVLSVLAAFDPGDRVAMSEPGYAAYRNILQALGVELVGVPVDESTRFVPTASRLEAAGPLAGLVVASPSNPTGTTIDESEMGAITSWCTGRGVRLVSDEIYHRITYAGPAPTALAFDATAIVVQSFSKYYSMTGWRLGWLILPEELVRPVELLAQNLYISPPTLSQRAALAAFDCGVELDANVARYARNREVVVTGLREAGIGDIAPPDGAFYVWADVSGITDDSQALSRCWLEELGVAVTPGIDFDPHRGHRFVRLSYSESEEDVREAMRRVRDWVTRHR